ncbi:winged helix-turn-helix domain-containing protein [Desulfonatronum thioautotrophicum]|uniref:winged helix-turn-helix domain-containing protein n=1 Tax=Desulfonatronum thioautotrophicum TaxID=617001 RepID=UPI0005EBC7E4|nr:LysR family transcriptional regulator [Desulfonatronum thioautotrophicum]
MKSINPPTLRLHLWLENEHGTLVGLGRAMLLARIKECGSLRQAAENLGISYRAAWGKVRQAQTYLGEDLVRKEGKGYVLTDFGEKLADGFLKWHDEVEQDALARARHFLPWPVQPHPSASSIPLHPKIKR